jgi:uncharacterized coiled-coil protein SlyX
MLLAVMWSPRVKWRVFAVACIALVLAWVSIAENAQAWIVTLETENGDLRARNTELQQLQTAEARIAKLETKVQDLEKQVPEKPPDWAWVFLGLCFVGLMMLLATYVGPEPVDAAKLKRQGREEAEAERRETLLEAQEAQIKLLAGLLKALVSTKTSRDGIQASVDQFAGTFRALANRPGPTIVVPKSESAPPTGDGHKRT